MVTDKQETPPQVPIQPEQLLLPPVVMDDDQTTEQPAVGEW